MTVITALQEWAQGHGYILLILSVCSLATFLGTLAVLPLVVARIPTTYFLRRKRTPGYRRSLVRFLYLVTKNLIGIIFFLSGLIMLFIPGQGLMRKHPSVAFEGDQVVVERGRPVRPCPARSPRR